jgi:hypothetical protein
MQAGIAVAERPWGIVPPADDVPYMVDRSHDEGEGPGEYGYDDASEDAASRRRRHGGPSLGH